MKNTPKIIAVVILIIIIIFVLTRKPVSAPVVVDTNPAVSENTTTNTNVKSNESVTTTPVVLVSYADPKGEFSFSYDKSFLLNTAQTQGKEWMQGSNYVGTLLATVTIPKSFMPGTNFSEAKLTLGKSTDQNAVKNCWEPGYAKSDSTISTINSVQFKKFTTSEGAAGNLYDTTSYHATIGNTCYAVEYIIHSTNIGNYPPDAGIKEFDKVKVVNALEKIVQSVKLKK